MKSRFLGESIIELQTLMHMAENFEEGKEFAVFSLEIYKAFDSIDWTFIHRTLEGFGFPPCFIQWINVIQHYVELQICNNGHLSHRISAVKGVAQGDALSPFLFILCIETLGIFLRQNTKFKGFSWQGMEKRVSFVADDSLIFAECDIENIEYLHTILSHFQAISGLKINYEKSLVIPLTPDPTWTNWDVIKQFKVLQYRDLFNYLGIQLPNLVSVNFPIQNTMIDDVLSARKIRSTCITGRILQIKSLIALKFVYRFMVLPSPPQSLLATLNTMYYQYVWEGGHHRISMDKMIAPKIVGGFNMLDVLSQEKSLKLKWVNRLLSERLNFSIWSVYIVTSFNIPITDALRANVQGKTFSILLTRTLPKIWNDIFSIWFDAHFVSTRCKAKSRRDDLLNSLLCFNQGIRGAEQIQDDEFFVHNF